MKNKKSHQAEKVQSILKETGEYQGRLTKWLYSSLETGTVITRCSSPYRTEVVVDQDDNLKESQWKLLKEGGLAYRECWIILQGESHYENKRQSNEDDDIPF